MEITKELVKEFVDNNYIDIDLSTTGEVLTVGIKYGYCKRADDNYGRKTVLTILNLLENDKEYQKLLNI
jgi:hypothetical protein